MNPFGNLMTPTKLL